MAVGAFQPVTSNQSIGQTLIANYDGLESVQVYLKPDPAADGTNGKIRLFVRSDVNQSENLRTAELSLEDISGEGFYRFQFAPLARSNGQNYYILLRLQGNGRFQVGIAGPEAYRNGGIYIGGAAAPGQLAFSLMYARSYLLAGLLGETLTWLFWLLCGAWLFVLPGWAILAGLWPGWALLTWAEKLGLAAGCSLAVYPILVLWTDLLGLHLGAGYAWLPGLAAAGYLAWHYRTGARSRLLRSIYRLRHPGRWSPDVPGDIALALVLGMTFFIRFWNIRGIPVPLWGDSYQHTMITQLLLDHGGLFTSWQPYIPYVSYTTHPGFSILSALFAWLTQASASKAVLVTGQLGNGLAVIALVPLAMRISGKNRWAAVGTVVLAGLFLHQPATYANWGRYPQMAGQAILPAAIWLLWDLCDPPAGLLRSRRQVALAAGVTGLVVAGMLLTYYRMAFFYAAFVLAWLVTWALPCWKLQARVWLENGIKMAFAAAAAFLFILPWMLRAQAGRLDLMVEAGISTGSPWAKVLGELAGWILFTDYVPYPVLILAILALLWGLWRRQWLLAGLVMWYALLPAYLASQALRVPGANMLQNFAILIALYIPASLLGGWMIGELATGLSEGFCRLTRPPRTSRLAEVLQATDPVRAAGWLLAGSAVLAGLWGAFSMRHLIQPDTYGLVNRPDIKAMEWIEANLPAEAVFLVEGWPIYNDQSAVGTDGGWWISLLAHRQNTMPPQYPMVSEIPDPPGYSQEMLDMVLALRQYAIDAPQVQERLCRAGVTHVYIGQGQGRIGSGVDQLFSSQELANSPAFETLYQQDQVSIYAFRREACSGG